MRDMRKRMPSLRLHLLVLVFVMVAISTMALRPSRSGADAERMSAQSREQFHALLRGGVVSQVRFAGQGATLERTRASIDSVDQFIASRSGLKLPHDFKERIASMEQRVLNGMGSRITVNQLSGMLVQTAAERAGRLKDEEITRSVRIMSGSDGTGQAGDQVGDMDPNQILHLRGNGIAIPANRFISYAKLLRDNAVSTRILLPISTAASQALRSEIQRRLDHLAQAAPDQWGKAAAEGLSPVQVVIGAYSAASDDYLWYSQYELQGIMKRIESSMRKKKPDYPSSEGRFAYGTTGYIFPSPLEILLDEPALNRLADRIQERSAK